MTRRRIKLNQHTGIWMLLSDLSAFFLFSFNKQFSDPHPGLSFTTTIRFNTQLRSVSLLMSSSQCTINGFIEHL